MALHTSHESCLGCMLKIASRYYPHRRSTGCTQCLYLGCCPIDDRCHTILNSFLQILAPVNWSSDNPKHQSASALWQSCKWLMVQISTQASCYELQSTLSIMGSTAQPRAFWVNTPSVLPNAGRRRTWLVITGSFFLHSKVAAEQRGWKWGRSQVINKFTVTMFARLPRQSSTTSVCCRAIAHLTNRCLQLWWSIQHRYKML